MADIEHILCESVYGAKTRQALVKITIRNEEVTIPVDDAIAFAGNLLECAEGAKTDKFIMEYGNLRNDQKIEMLLTRRKMRRNEESK